MECTMREHRTFVRELPSDLFDEGICVLGVTACVPAVHYGCRRLPKQPRRTTQSSERHRAAAAPVRSTQGVSVKHALS